MTPKDATTEESRSHTPLPPAVWSCPENSIMTAQSRINRSQSDSFDEIDSNSSKNVGEGAPLLSGKGRAHISCRGVHGQRKPWLTCIEVVRGWL